MRYRKRPVVVEAFQLFIDDMPQWFVEALDAGTVRLLYGNHRRCEIHTLEGIMNSFEGDYIIQGVEGEIYSCKPGIFEITYEEE